MDNLNKKKYIFGSLFLLANKLQVMGDQYLGKDDITTKQWLLTVMISQFGDSPPTLTEVAELMGSSRQNVKQLALKLEEKDFLRIEKDPKDARAFRLKLTEKSLTFWEKRKFQDDEFIKNLFINFSEDEINAISSGFIKLHKKLDNLERIQYEA